MAAACAPAEADASSAALLFATLLLLTRQLSVVVVVFEVARGRLRRSAAGTLTIVPVRHLRLTVIDLYTNHNHARIIINSARMVV